MSNEVCRRGLVLLLSMWVVWVGIGSAPAWADEASGKSSAIDSPRQGTPPKPEEKECAEKKTISTPKIKMSGTLVGAGLGVAWGEGTFELDGELTEFTIQGFGVAKAGLARLTATGYVCGLRSPADLEGQYVGGEVGLAVGGGGFGMLMHNFQKGVTLHIGGTLIGIFAEVGVMTGLSVSLK